MECREFCGACCIQISITTPIPQMNGEKKGGVNCIHLTDDLKCAIFDSPDRPKVCDGFKYDSLVCGKNRREAMQILGDLEGVGYDENKDKFASYNEKL